MTRRTLLFSVSVLAGSFLIPVGSGFAQMDANRAADNSAVNQRDRGHENLTPMDQSNKPSDLKMTREIRRAIVKDDQLSTDAKNIKIITIDGAVTSARAGQDRSGKGGHSSQGRATRRRFQCSR